MINNIFYKYVCLGTLDYLTPITSLDEAFASDFFHLNCLRPMKKNFSFLLALSTTLVLCGVAATTHAQGPGPGGPPKPTPATGVPIDGGAAMLLAGGVAYGLQRLRRRARG